MSVYILVAAGVVVCFLVLAWIFRDRPLNDTDRECAAIDEQLDLERARRARRVARQQDREGMRFGSVTVLSDARRTHKR